MNRQKRIFPVLLLMVGLSPSLAVAGNISLELIGSYPADPIGELCDEGAAEAVVYDTRSQVLLVSNRANQAVDIIDVSDPANPLLATAIDVSGFGDEPTAVAVSNGLAAVTVVDEVVTDNGRVVLFDVAAALLGIFDPTVIEVGPLPDGLQFTPNGHVLVVVNEGEPNDEYTVDPEGSVSIIHLRSMRVRTADFRKYNKSKRLLQRQGIRIFGPGATVAQDLEPENLTISDDSSTAWVTLQENNALAVVDLRSARVKKLMPLGYKFHLAPMNSFDASNKDDTINLQPWPVFGMYQPDGIASFTAFGRTYLITANEGDARDYDGFSEEARVKDLTLTDIYEQYWPGIQEPENLGQLKTTTAPPMGKVVNSEGEEVYSLIYAYGARSFTIWSDRGMQVYDSKNDLEEITAAEVPDFFNTNNDENKFDSRSDDKGPEPEGVTVGEVAGTLYAFVGLERMGGIMTYDISYPWYPRFVGYVNDRLYDGDPYEGEAGHLGPETMAFIPEEASPKGQALLAVAHEVSGTTTLYEIVPTP